MEDRIKAEERLQIVFTVEMILPDLYPGFTGTSPRRWISGTTGVSEHEEKKESKPSVHFPKDKILFWAALFWQWALMYRTSRTRRTWRTCCFYYLVKLRTSEMKRSFGGKSRFKPLQPLSSLIDVCLSTLLQTFIVPPEQTAVLAAADNSHLAAREIFRETKPGSPSRWSINDHATQGSTTSSTKTCGGRLRRKINACNVHTEKMLLPIL